MTRTTNCLFCKLGIEGMTQYTAQYSHKIYEDDYCYAVLEREQSVDGYTLVILKEHKDTILDRSITNEQLVGFWSAVRKIGDAIKDGLGAENVYVCSLCDGVAHFHVHLVPRYKWTDADKGRYRELFTVRDGEKAVNMSITLGLIGGFWYLADTEREYMNRDFMKLPVGERGYQLQQLAQKIKEAIR